MRKQHSPTFKAEVVTEVLKEEKTIAQIASEHGVHPVQISQWRTAALKGLPLVFERDGKALLEQKAVLDWYSRYVVSWEIEQTLEERVRARVHEAGVAGSDA